MRSPFRAYGSWMNKMEENKDSILERELREYTESGIYPMHMPGHKRSPAMPSSLPYDFDLTEVEGTDDLHHASGILQDAMDRTGFLYGSRRTWYLVNGSTCGILAGIRAATHFGGDAVVARNCHRSVYHALELCGLHVRYIWPDVDPGTGLCGSIRPEQVQSAISHCPGCEAVILTSPTYEGVLSDIRGIADICHERDIPLIVDEAHGAHLGLFPESGFPKGALELGADLVIQSPHKTLMSLTQTAWMHLGSHRIRGRRIEEQLSVFETSSPSYPLLVSLDACTCALHERGDQIFDAWKKRLALFDMEAAGLHHFRILWHGDERDRRYAKFFDTDPSKIVVLCTDGYALAKKLREDFAVETEMAFPGGVLAMTGAGDTQEGMDRLAEALHKLDAQASQTAAVSHRPAVTAPAFRPRALCTIQEAVSRNYRELNLQDAEGRVSAEYLYCYPPGIPILAPGEVITGESILYLKDLEKSGAQVRRSRGSSGRRIFCMEE